VTKERVYGTNGGVGPAWYAIGGKKNKKIRHLKNKKSGREEKGRGNETRIDHRCETGHSRGGKKRGGRFYSDY